MNGLNELKGEAKKFKKFLRNPKAVITDIITETYGSSINTKKWPVVVLSLIGIALSIVGFLRLGTLPGDNLLGNVDLALNLYVGVFLLVTGLLLPALFWYSQPPKRSERPTTKLMKIIFAFSLFILFIAAVLPFVVSILIVSLIGDRLGIGDLVRGIDRIISGLAGFMIWLFTTIFLLVLFLNVANYFSNSMVWISVEVAVSYSLFLGLALGNKITTFFYFKLIGENNHDKKVIIKHQLDILWASTVLVMSFALKPIKFPDSAKELQIFVDAFFYSVSTLTLLTKLSDLRKKSPTVQLELDGESH